MAAQDDSLFICCCVSILISVLINFYCKGSLSHLCNVNLVRTLVTSNQLCRVTTWKGSIVYWSFFSFLSCCWLELILGWHVHLFKWRKLQWCSGYSDKQSRFWYRWRSMPHTLYLASYSSHPRVLPFKTTWLSFMQPWSEEIITKKKTLAIGDSDQNFTLGVCYCEYKHFKASRGANLSYKIRETLIVHSIPMALDRDQELRRQERAILNVLLVHNLLIWCSNIHG